MSLDTRYLSFERIAGRFAGADRALSLQVEAGTLAARETLAVLHQVADSLSDGAPEFREALIPHRTEAAALEAKGAA